MTFGRLSRWHDPHVSEPEDPFDDQVLDPAVIPGAWANDTRVRVGRDEFTVDFLRQVPGYSRSFLVARAVVSPAAAIELRDQLEDAWRRYADWSMPKDANDG